MEWYFFKDKLSDAYGFIYCDKTIIGPMQTQSFQVLRIDNELNSESINQLIDSSRQWKEIMNNET